MVQTLYQVKIYSNSPYKPDKDYGLQAILQLGTNPHYLTVRAVGHTLTGQTSLASTPCNWHPYWFYNPDEPLIDDTSHHLLTRTSDDDTSHNFTLERTQLFTPPFDEYDTSNVFLLQFRSSDLKLSTRMDVAVEILDVHFHPIRDWEDTILFYIERTSLTIVSLLLRYTMCILLTPVLYFITTVIIEVYLQCLLSRLVWEI